MQEVFPLCWKSTIPLFDRFPEAIFSAVLGEAHSDVEIPVFYPPVPSQAGYLPIGALTPTYLVIQIAYHQTIQCMANNG